MEAESFSKSKNVNATTTNRHKNKRKLPTNLGFRKREQRDPIPYREDQYIYKKLAAISTPIMNLCPLKQVERKFSGRARLFIGNLSPKITNDEIKSLFSKYGEIDEVFINADKGYGFIQMDYNINAERAKTELCKYSLQGRTLMIRNAHPAAIKIKNIPPYVSNELLYLAFSVFGEIELAYVIVDERGKPTNEGIVEYIKKPSALLALKKCSELCFFLTSSLRPMIVENYEPPIDTIGHCEAMIKRSQIYYSERKVGPRFASPGSFHFEYAERWKELFNVYKDKIAELKAERHLEEQRLDAKMLSTQYDYETKRLKKMLRDREIDKERYIKEFDTRQYDINLKLQDNLFVQAGQHNNLLDHQERDLEKTWYQDDVDSSRPRKNGIEVLEIASQS